MSSTIHVLMFVGCVQLSRGCWKVTVHVNERELSKLPKTLQIDRSCIGKHRPAFIINFRTASGYVRMYMYMYVHGSCFQVE